MIYIRGLREIIHASSDFEAKRRYVYTRIKAAATPVPRSCRVRRLRTRDMEIVVATTEGRMATNYPRPYGVSRCPWKPVANAGTWRFQKRGLFPRCVWEETPAYILASIPCPISLFLSPIRLSSLLPSLAFLPPVDV